MSSFFELNNGKNTVFMRNIRGYIKKTYANIALTIGIKSNLTLAVYKMSSIAVKPYSDDRSFPVAKLEIEILKIHSLNDKWLENGYRVKEGV